MLKKIYENRKLNKAFRISLWIVAYVINPLLIIFSEGFFALDLWLKLLIICTLSIVAIVGIICELKEQMMYYSEMEKEYYRLKEKVNYLLDIIEEKDKKINELAKQLEERKNDLQ